MKDLVWQFVTKSNKMNNCPIETELSRILFSRKLKVAIAESCTGGLVCHRLTNVPGSSEYMGLGIVAYSNQAKIDILGVPPWVIDQNGAVSEACVEAMALGVHHLSNADISIAISGIAGPSGGSAEKPVGTVCIAVADTTAVNSWRFLFPGNRAQIKEQACTRALTLIRDHCLQYPQ